jgi:succinate-acetate transporter protein
MAQIATERAEAAAVANPGPLGLSAFALTTFVLSCTNAQLIPTVSGLAIVVGTALFYGGIAQILAGMWEFRTGNTFGATAFTSYGAFWLAVGWSIQNKLILSHTAFGYFLLGWTIFTGIMILCSLRVTYAHVALFVLLFLAFLSLTIAELSGGSATFTILGGWLGIVTALVAWYTALSGLLGRTGIFSLPVGART